MIPSDGSRVPRAALQCARGGNVLPVTSLDRHTGRVALATSELPLFAENTNATDEATVGDPQHPAGSRVLNWRSPSAVEANGETSDDSVGAAAGSLSTGLFLRSYSESKCSNQTPLEHRSAWLSEVGVLTRPFRARRAMRHRGRARHMTDSGHYSCAEYHLMRAEGQMLRMTNVAACGEREVLFSCGDCGHQLRKAVAHCGHIRLCNVCRGKRARRYRLKIRAARRRVLDDAERSLRVRNHRGEWHERFVTLTIAHSGDVVRDLKTLPKAWKLFRRWLWLFFASEHRLDKELLKLIAFVRVTEVTAGQSNDGHAHYHVWLYCPYIPHEVARHLWGKALRKFGYIVPMRPVEDVIAEARTPFAAAQLRRTLVTRGGPKGRPLTETEWPVLDLKQAYGDVEAELVKYLVKDVVVEGGTTGMIDPELYARIYEGLEGLRTIATSRKFFQEDVKDCFCEQCGSTRLKRAVAKPAVASVAETTQPGADSDVGSGGGR
jgi:Zn finger protein HypA/HybF involved in hydrogenase expression